MDFVNSAFDSDSEEAGNHISPEIAAAASAAVEELFLIKSKGRYEIVYKQFQSWCQKKNVKNVVCESVLLAYFMEKAKGFKCSSMWSHNSMLKSTMNIRHNVSIGNFSKLVSFLKRKNDGDKAKKSRVFSEEEFYKFLQKAEDSKYLVMKVAFIFGVAGALRRAELTNMSTDDIEDRSAVLIIRVPDTKTKICRTFIGDTEEINLLEVYRKYALLRPTHTGHKRFFVNYRHETRSTQVVGINTIGKIPSLIAEYLDLKNPAEYTGHAFRRSSATFLADARADILQLKRHGGWRSTSTAETYVEDSIQNKVKTANQILGEGHRIIKMSEVNAGGCSENIVVTETKKTGDDKENKIIGKSSAIQISNGSNCVFTFSSL
ncbi:uncharacterized protein LOC135135240 [Zophobas morio]|uniref:uncharacterized protein LOC135135240 n=1 Tax=Zophobas morio TaxID=2755281 RepID=UPI003083258F